MNILFVPRVTPALTEYMQSSAPAIRTIARIRKRLDSYIFRLKFTLKKSGHLLILLFAKKSRAANEFRVIRVVGSGWDVAMRMFVEQLLKIRL